MLSKFEQKNRFAYQLALFVTVVIILLVTTAFTSSNNFTGFKEKPGTLYTDTLFWSAENNEVYLKGEVRVKHGENNFKGNGSFSVLGKVSLLIVNGTPAPLNSAIILSGRKCTIVRLTGEEAVQKYGPAGKLGAVEITAPK